jgi:anti-sigma regulatory factor (Ser/Thr protein kinase)
MSLSIVPTLQYKRTLYKESDAYAVAQEAKALAYEVGLSEFDSGMLALSTSEIATNAIRHAKHGLSTIQRTANNKGVEVTIEDSGQGISDLNVAFRDGFSTYGSLGLGLGAARRSVDEMQFNKNDSSGVSITLRTYLHTAEEDMDIGAVSFSATHELRNGDAYIIKEYHGDCVLVGVFDGAGTGEKAAVSSKIAAEVAKRNYKLPLNELITLIDRLLRQSLCERTVEMCLLRLTSDTLECAAIGNVSVFSRTEPKITFPIQNGSAGMVLPTPIHVTSRPRPKKFFFALHSDGIEKRNIESFMEGTHSSHYTAQCIFDGLAVAHDDATVVVIKG